MWPTRRRKTIWHCLSDWAESSYGFPTQKFCQTAPICELLHLVKSREQVTSTPSVPKRTYQWWCLFLKFPTLLFESKSTLTLLMWLTRRRKTIWHCLSDWAESSYGFPTQKFCHTAPICELLHLVKSREQVPKRTHQWWCLSFLKFLTLLMWLTRLRKTICHIFRLS